MDVMTKDKYKLEDRLKEVFEEKKTVNNELKEMKEKIEKVNNKFKELSEDKRHCSHRMSCFTSKLRSARTK